MSKIRIVASGWENFSGDFGGVQFTDGVSEEIGRPQVDRLAALVQCEMVEDGRQAGEAQRQIDLNQVGADVAKALPRQTEEENETEKRLEAMNSEKPPTTLYDKKQLETIASAEGIKGLRAIAKFWNVKDRSIPRIIFEILKAQSNWSARQAEKIAERKRASAAAMDEMLARQKAEEDAINAAARVLSDGGISNTIGAQGENAHTADAPDTEIEFTDGDSEIVTTVVTEAVPVLGPTGPSGMPGVAGDLDVVEPNVSLDELEALTAPDGLADFGQDTEKKAD